MQRAAESQNRFYRNLNWAQGGLYINSDRKTIMWIFKARCDIIGLNGNRFAVTEERKYCAMCNMREVESINHFLARCPVLREFRRNSFSKNNLSHDELIDILNGKNENDWINLVNFIKHALPYRKSLILEFNY